MNSADYEEISHAICMGIRKGLFGKNADDGHSIGDELYSQSAIADEMRRLACAVEDMVEVLKKQQGGK